MVYLWLHRHPWLIYFKAIICFVFIGRGVTLMECLDGEVLVKLFSSLLHNDQNTDLQATSLITAEGDVKYLVKLKPFFLANQAINHIVRGLVYVGELARCNS